METSRSLELELAELICVEHTLSPSDTAGSGELKDAPHPDRVMCLKVGTAILETLTRQSPIMVAFTEGELWILRERVSIYTSQGAQTDLGLTIKAKIYQALLAIENQRQAAAIGIAASAEEGSQATAQEVKDALWKRQKEADSAPPTDEDADENDADDRPKRRARPKA